MGKKSKSAASTEAGASQPSGKQAKPQADKQAKPAKADEHATGDKKRAAKATIDDIFGKKKKPRAGEEQAKVEEDDKGASVSHSALEELGKQIQEARATTKAPKVVGSKDDIFGENTGARKRTVDGLVIYSEDELGLSKKGGGDTDLCPFDCDCCF